MLQCIRLRVIAAQQPDLAALQELDRGTRRSAGRDVLQELADATGMTGTYGQAIAYQGGAYGVGILSRKPPLRAYQRPLACPAEPRTLLVCEFDAFVLFCTHLSLVAESRAAAVEVINREQRAFGKPVFLAGDFNATLDHPVLSSRCGFVSVTEATGAAGWGTWPRSVPALLGTPIDHVFVDPARWNPVHTWIVDVVGSDHRAVVARLAEVPALGG